jgi:hypothetical protein
VTFVARHGWRLLPDYTFEPTTGLWRHRLGPVEPPLRLHQVRYDPATGAMCYPRHDEPVPESALAGYLAEAERIVSAPRPPRPRPAGEPAPLSADFEQLRWFELPTECLQVEAAPSAG